METGLEAAAAKGTNYGAVRMLQPARAAAEGPHPAAPVHANVDLPFRPLAPFVPAGHWERLEKPPHQTWLGTWRNRLVAASSPVLAALRRLRTPGVN